jgi:hypothetical protein
LYVLASARFVAYTFGATELVGEAVFDRTVGTCGSAVPVGVKCVEVDVAVDEWDVVGGGVDDEDGACAADENDGAKNLEVVEGKDVDDDVDDVNDEYDNVEDDVLVVAVASAEEVDSDDDDDNVEDDNVEDDNDNDDDGNGVAIEVLLEAGFVVVGAVEAPTPGAVALNVALDAEEGVTVTGSDERDVVSTAAAVFDEIVLGPGVTTAGRVVSEETAVVEVDSVLLEEDGGALGEVVSGGVAVPDVVFVTGITARDVGDDRNDDPSENVGDDDVSGGGLLDELSLLSGPRLAVDANEAVAVNDDRLGSESAVVGMLATIGALETLDVSLENRRAMMGRRGSRRPKGPIGLASTVAVAARRSKGSDISML